METPNASVGLMNHLLELKYVVEPSLERRLAHKLIE